MRFITEIELEFTNKVKLEKIEIPNTEYIQYSNAYTGRGELELGYMISKSFGWKERGETTLDPISPIAHKYKLEIEAFPMGKWVEFKEKILDMKLYYESDVKVIEQYIQELESFGNPVTEKQK